MDSSAGLGLFLAGAFALIVTALRTPAIEYYTGGIFVGLFIFGLFFAWANAIRQSKKLGTVGQSVQPQAESVKQEATQ